ncbi:MULTISPECIES: bifunctional 4-hydroxy-2-oxoglutarate aldolase/2-dehydro-3-deoxy-phosphogluconate aldolase [unclassified Sporosarcina]|uniref:bifunctional 4-hydroxy-2-oxoglutarate aldolase/2-dehydro-3-deoxy-phosphogluconate aldolase n=1 Tax=unclassified Sporosarcina TaxID=2647733 RepID=UPI000C171B57|nr:MULTISPECIES: bifunctional 4-hydroxy-2-oxoglutarate aldolase/2-dehydro-3-deoxy-phosphogluconate aldolase [unclassified Sporosarcina]PIC98571.1 2-dehydro-3-deoxyphosphogluconate aldolase [Sporosarcina sp. P29]PID05998.1 2-dehydro-3-deoxyphosphogluconate aldolase [Sporosarcina sp. P30]PID09192.1 2-dehydro-3-deoxyphosphogluconate aldolase [Sporosarcina sp. P31]PID12490.1 2-dehydro-3-deoxyphosphogluconate aldolase [Sporosarcina sp. P32b]
MRKWDKLKVIEENGVVVVLRKIHPERINKVIETLVNSGIKVLEITADSENSYDTIRDMKKRYGDQVLIGAGTVIDKETAKLAADAQADFIFSPNLDVEVIQTANRYGCISIPGVYTPTEIVTAYTAGADLVKVFPAATLGPSYFKDLQGPLAHIPMMPTGGIGLENMGEFLANGAIAIGVGSSLLNKKLIDTGNYEELSEKAKSFVNRFNEVKACESKK